MKTIKKIIAFVILLSIAWYCSFSFYFTMLNATSKDFPHQLWWNIPTMIFGMLITACLFIAIVAGITFLLISVISWSINQFKPMKQQLPPSITKQSNY